MTTGYTKTDLDRLYHALENFQPPTPRWSQRPIAATVTAMRVAGTDLGALFNFELDGSPTQLMWFNCCAAKELAGAFNNANKAYNWSKRGLKAAASGHLHAPLVEDLALASEVGSLATFGDHSGVLVRLAIGPRPKQQLLFFPAGAALEAVGAIVQGATIAKWWDENFDLIPSRKSQH